MSFAEILLIASIPTFSFGLGLLCGLLMRRPPAYDDRAAKAHGMIDVEPEY